MGTDIANNGADGFSRNATQAWVDGTLVKLQSSRSSLIASFSAGKKTKSEAELKATQNLREIVLSVLHRVEELKVVARLETHSSKIYSPSIDHNNTYGNAVEYAGEVKTFKTPGVKTETSWNEFESAGVHHLVLDSHSWQSILRAPFPISALRGFEADPSSNLAESGPNKDKSLVPWRCGSTNQGALRFLPLLG